MGWNDLIHWSPTREYHHDIYPSIDPTRPALSAKGKVIVINGGTRGIGLAIAKAFVQAGAKDVVITGRKQSTLDAAKTQMEQQVVDGIQKTRIHTFVEDVTDTKAVEKTYTTVGSTIGPVDVAVSNAGQTHRIPVSDLDPDEFWNILAVNTKGPLNVIKGFMKVAVKDAVLVNVNSGVAHQPPLWGPFASYAASKAATFKVHEYLQHENPELRVFTLQPGVIPTDMTASVGAGKEETSDGKCVSLSPFSRSRRLFVQMQSNCPAGFASG